MDDNTVLQRIDALSKEELELEESRASEALSRDRLHRLQSIEVELDQCWDLLRRREAREEFGQNPNDESTRPEEVVKRYLQ